MPSAAVTPNASVSSPVRRLTTSFERYMNRNPASALYPASGVLDSAFGSATSSGVETSTPSAKHMKYGSDRSAHSRCLKMPRIPAVFTTAATTANAAIQESAPAGATIAVRPRRSTAHRRRPRWRDGTAKRVGASTTYSSVRRHRSKTRGLSSSGESATGSALFGASADGRPRPYRGAFLPTTAISERAVGRTSLALGALPRRPGPRRDAPGAGRSGGARRARRDRPRRNRRE